MIWTGFTFFGQGPSRCSRFNRAKRKVPRLHCGLYVVRVRTPRKPCGQSAVSGVGLQFLTRHPYECLGHRLVFKFAGLARSPFGTVGDFSSCLNVSANCIPHLRFSNQFGPCPCFGIVRDCLFQLVSLGI